MPEAMSCTASVTFAPYFWYSTPDRHSIRNYPQPIVALQAG